MSSLAPESGRKFRNLLSRTHSQEHPKTPPAPSLQSSQNEKPHTTHTTPQDPFNIHPGECVLEESDFQTRKSSVLFGPWRNGRVYRPIRRRHSPETSESSYKRADDRFSICQREEREIALQADPYHQYVYSTKGNESPLQNKRTGVDRATQTLPPVCTPNLAEKIKLEPGTERLILPSFIDPFDCAVSAFNTSNTSAEIPVGIPNSPYDMNGMFESTDPSHPSYDADWEEHLFDPVPGAGVYVGELIDRTGKLSPKDWNVVYISLHWATGEVVVRALPFNRRGMRVGLHDGLRGERELKRADIELRRGFGERLALNMEEEALWEIKRICKERLEREAELDYERELRFEGDVKSFRTEKCG